MINNITIKNYKSIKDVKLDLARINVFIGENGAGKSNVLEAIAIAGAAQARKLDNEFLTSRGVRTTEPQWMRNAAKGAKGAKTEKILISAKCDDSQLSYEISMDDSPYPKWHCKLKDQVKVELDIDDVVRIMNHIKSNTASDKQAAASFMELIRTLGNSSTIIGSPTREPEYTVKDTGLEFIRDRAAHTAHVFKALSEFIIYSPENTALRTFEKEGQIEPLGINGEGVLKLLTVLDSENDKSTINNIKNSLKVLGWFRDFEIELGGANTPSRMRIDDRWLDDNLNGFDQKSANEGFLFLVFYFCLFSSELTPKFFAVDNIDASLNPKLCEHLIVKLYELGKTHDKQAILTADNPAVLDGIDLNNDDFRLFVVARGGKGQTRVRRVLSPEIIPGHRPLRLSEAFIRGHLGGLPEGF